MKQLRRQKMKKAKSKHSFNDTVIKDGWIVKVRKDGRIKTKVERYKPTHQKKG